jgi:hypothetical protein
MSTTDQLDGEAAQAPRRFTLRPPLTPSRHTVDRGVSLLGYGLLLAMALVTASATPGIDMRMYFDTGLTDPYAGSVLGDPNYTYTPVLTQVIEPLRWLGWEAFRTTWILAGFAALAYLVGPWLGLILVVAYFPPLVWEFDVGNVNLFIAVAIWAGFRYPALWAIPILLKPPLAIGLLWFALRGERRKLAIAVGATGIVALISFIVAPNLWVEYAETVGGFVDTAGSLPAVPWPLRMAVGVGLVAWGARRSQHWTVALAAILAHPLSSLSGWVVALGFVRHYFLSGRYRVASEPPAGIKSPGGTA